ncbi:hypothetical protein BD769DRAFT_1642411 [Suillus cothurnatus]|nr:hypothetical protein BD769DRAFT_1642411 [Suillus cothurnatus]
MAVVGICSSCIYRAHQDYTNFRILDALHLALIIHCVYFYLVINYAIKGALTEIVWSSKLQPVVAACTPQVFTIFVEHLYFLHQQFCPDLCGKPSKGRSKVLPITVGIVVVLTSGLAIGESSLVLSLIHYSKMIKPLFGTYTMHHDVYRPRYHVRASQDEGPQASWKSMFRHSDEVLHITRPGQAVLPRQPIEVAMEMNSPSSA